MSPGCDRVRRVSFLLVMLCFSRVALAAHYDHPTKGYSIDYPDSWHRNTRFSSEAPLTLTNFDEYLHGGVLPPGGVEITMLALSPTLDENVMLVPDTQAMNVKRYTQSIEHRDVLRAEYDSEAGRVVYHITSVCIRVGGKLFRIMIEHEHQRPDEEETAATERVLAQIIGSLKTTGAQGSTHIDAPR